jgi:hypothetical protein
MGLGRFQILAIASAPACLTTASSIIVDLPASISTRPPTITTSESAPLASQTRTRRGSCSGWVSGPDGSTLVRSALAPGLITPRSGRLIAAAASCVTAPISPGALAAAGLRQRAKKILVPGQQRASVPTDPGRLGPPRRPHALHQLDRPDGLTAKRTAACRIELPSPLVTQMLDA